MKTNLKNGWSISALNVLKIERHSVSAEEVISNKRAEKIYYTGL
jgi:hypothetical protein